MLWLKRKKLVKVVQTRAVEVGKATIEITLSDGRAMLMDMCGYVDYVRTNHDVGIADITVISVKEVAERFLRTLAGTGEYNDIFVDNVTAPTASKRGTVTAAKLVAIAPYTIQVTKEVMVYAVSL